MHLSTSIACGIFLIIHNASGHVIIFRKGVIPGTPYLILGVSFYGEYYNRIAKIARIVAKPEEYLWSSASVHLSGKDDILVRVSPLLEMIGDLGEVLSEAVEDQRIREIRRHANELFDVSKQGVRS